VLISYLAVEFIGAVLAVIDSVATLGHENAVPIVAVEILHAGVEAGLHLHRGVGGALVVPAHSPAARPFTQTG
jgi:hypothetical protein